MFHSVLNRLRNFTLPFVPYPRHSPRHKGRPDPFLILNKWPINPNRQMIVLIINYVSKLPFRGIHPPTSKPQAETELALWHSWMREVSKEKMPEIRTTPQTFLPHRKQRWVRECEGSDGMSPRMPHYKTPYSQILFTLLELKKLHVSGSHLPIALQLQHTNTSYTSYLIKVGITYNPVN